MTARAHPPVDRDAIQQAMKRLGRRIAGARTERSLSQVEVAEMAETSPARVSAIENATDSARIDTIVRVATAVGLELSLRDVAAA
jgi:transcriptional regulator with XRE-family HTH domain